MKKVLMIAIAALCCLGAQAQKVDEFGIFDHVGVGVGFGTSGIDLEVAAPVTDYMQVRAGYTFFPKLSYDEDVKYRPAGGKSGDRKETNVEGKLNMANAKLLFDFYPFRQSTFHATVGAFMGTDEIIKAANTVPVLDYATGEGIEIGDYIVGFNSEGYAQAAIKVNKFKPYVGIGFGHAVPRKRCGVTFDLGVQFWGTPGVYEKQTGTYQKVSSQDLNGEDDGILETLSRIKVWPVLSIKFNGRIF
jgi:hypothetical protein